MKARTSKLKQRIMELSSGVVSGQVARDVEVDVVLLGSTSRRCALTPGR